MLPHTEEARCESEALACVEQLEWGLAWHFQLEFSASHYSVQNSDVLRCMLLGVTVSKWCE
jgi:hypothetical protein